MTNKWDYRFISLAAHVSSWSKDPSTRCGAVIADSNHRIFSIGFNGLPVGIADDDRLSDRTIKYKIILHAEENALLFCREQELTHATIYISPMSPCAHCASLIIQRGIKRIVTIEPSQEQSTRWSDDWRIAAHLYQEAGVELIQLDTEY